MKMLLHIVSRMVKMFVMNRFVIIVIIAMFVFILFYNFFNEREQNSYHKLELYSDLNPFIKSNTARVLNLRMEGKCSQLHDIAKEMLAGERIKLPFKSNKTRWKFYQPNINLNELKKTSFHWNYPWSSRKHRNISKYYFNLYKKVKSKNIKNRKYFITFAHNCCYKSKLNAEKYARYPGGFDFVSGHDLNSLNARFRRVYSSILEEKRGAGYWLWKPYILLRTLIENMADNDLVMYEDAGSYLIFDAGPLLKLTQHIKNGILLFHTKYKERQMTKRDTFILMNMDNNHVYDTYQRQASFLIIRKTCKSLQFVMEWLAYATDARILTDQPNQMGKGNLDGFLDHRHDQSILSLLSKKWGILAYRDPSQYGQDVGKYFYESGPYKQIIHHSRDRE